MNEKKTSAIPYATAQQAARHQKCPENNYWLRPNVTKYHVV